ncbi:MFS transporter [Streptomyces sp. NBC_01537]|uniref:2-oxoglutarate and iron-dependent oxygenase domain-containing protein n=1 Tax=Streptomyces sp. NBC_01537 TaxID=2903896 RepID=UPI0038649EE8
MTELRTFHLPESVTGSDSDVSLGRELIRTWQTDGIFQVAANEDQDRKTARAIESSKRFFEQPMEFKAQRVSDLTYSGYIASGEEVTAGEADFSEIFTVTKDIAPDDSRVQAQWPCHGPTPWPDDEYRQSMQAYMDELGTIGEKLLRLVALGLGLDDIDALTKLTHDGWHHMRVLRFPAKSPATDRGIGAHTDYGLLVIATQDEVGQALYIRPPVEGERRNRNWLPEESAAGVFEDDDHWTYVRPVARTFTVFPGDVMQLITNGALLSTPHKVKLADRERYAFAYFHEPSFEAVARPLDPASTDEPLHYGSHFTDMFMRCYPDRITTRRILDEDRVSVLSKLREAALEV